MPVGPSPDGERLAAGGLEALLAVLLGQPEDPEGWLMLGRSYAAMNRLTEARDALSEAYRQRPRHPLPLLRTQSTFQG